jgi:hypothetical protein
LRISLVLPDDLAARLALEATELGLPLAEHIVRVLASRDPADVPSERPLAGAELIAYWTREGIIGSRADIEDPVQHARELRERNQHRRHA